MKVLRKLSRFFSSPFGRSVSIPSRAAFAGDPELERRQLMARETLVMARKHVDRAVEKAERELPCAPADMELPIG